MILAPTLLLNAGSAAAIARPTFSRDFAGERTLNKGTGPAITFTRASIGTFFDASGTLQTATNDTPRFDHDPATGASRGLLIEESRQNSLLNSATLATQSVFIGGVPFTLSFYGTGSVALSGVHSATVTGSGASARTVYTFTPSSGSLTLTVTGTVTNAQLEQGAFPTSYIPTTSAAVTRAADSAIVTPISSFYNAAEGTLFAEASRTHVAKPVEFAIFNNEDDAPVANFIALESGVASPEVQRFQVSGAAVLNYANGAANTVYRMAGAYAANDFIGAQNGALTLADTSGTVPTVNRLSIGMGSTTAVASYNGAQSHIRRIAYWPKRLSNALLQSLTT